MKNLDTNLFTEEELVNDQKKIHNSFQKIENFLNKIIEKETSLDFPFTPDFIDHDYNVSDPILNEFLPINHFQSPLAQLTSDILLLIYFIYSYYLKIEINNKIKSGLLTFENGYKEYVKFQYSGGSTHVFDSSNESRDFHQKFESKIRNQRKNLFDHYEKLADSEKQRKVTFFWKDDVKELFFEEFPLFKYFINLMLPN